MFEKGQKVKQKMGIGAFPQPFEWSKLQGKTLPIPI